MWKIYEDGSFSLQYGSITLEHCYPSFDYYQIKALSVKTTPNAIVYAGKDFEIQLDFSKENDNLIKIDSVLRMNGTTPSVVYPISSAIISGADRYYKQGFGFGGPCKLNKLDESFTNKSEDSYLTTSLIDEDEGSMTFCCYEHHDYLSKATIYNRGHRQGLNDQSFGGSCSFFEFGFHTEKIDCNGEIVFPSIYIYLGQGVYQTLHTAARGIAAANAVKPLKAPRYHYCSWYHRGCYFNMDDLKSTLDGFDNISPKLPLQSIQIDDGYQPVYGEWLEPSINFPNTVKEGFELIEKHGYVPGVWVGPFMVGQKSFIYREHKDWLLHELDGSLHVEWRCNDGGAKNLLQNDEEIYFLDTSNPEAFEYLRTVFRTLRQWGARLYKTDFMDWGYRANDQYKRFCPGKTSAQYFSDVIKMIREEIGEDSYWLACISPLQPFVGIADGLRIGNDIVGEWNERNLFNLLNETIYDQYFNNVFWQNDPDVTYVRDILTEMSPEESEALAVWSALTGGSINTSDPLHRVCEDSLNLWRFLEPSDKHVVSKIPNYSDPSCIDEPCQVLQYDESTWAVYFLNYKDYTRGLSEPLKELIGHDEAYAFNWNYKTCSPLGKVSMLTGKIKPHNGALFFVTLNPEQKPFKHLLFRD